MKRHWEPPRPSFRKRCRNIARPVVVLVALLTTMGWTSVEHAVADLENQLSEDHDHGVEHHGLVVLAELVLEVCYGMFNADVAVAACPHHVSKMCTSVLIVNTPGYSSGMHALEICRW